MVKAIKQAALGFLLPIAGIYAMVYIAVNFGERIVESTGGPVSFVVGLVIAPFVYLLNALASVVFVLFVVVATILGSISLSPLGVIILLLCLILMKLNQTH